MNWDHTAHRLAREYVERTHYHAGGKTLSGHIGDAFLAGFRAKRRGYWLGILTGLGLALMAVGIYWRMRA